MFPIFILLLAAMIDFGIGLYSYQTLINSARDGARLASTACSVAPCEGAVAARVAVAAGGLAPGVTVTCVTSAGAAQNCATGTALRGDMVTVTATYTYRMIWPLTFGTTIPMTSSVQYMVE